MLLVRVRNFHEAQPDAAGSTVVTCQARFASRDTATKATESRPVLRGETRFCAAKFGVIGLSKGAALDYADKNIRVRPPDDGSHLWRRRGGAAIGHRAGTDSAAWDAGGIAGTVLRLCSDLAAFTTGANIVVDGGQTT